MNLATNKMHSEDLGKLAYLQAWDLQEQLRAKRSKNEICDRLLLLEHNPVYTIGKRNADNDFLSSLEEIAKAGEVMVYRYEGNWECMDHGRDVVHLNKLWKNSQAFWKVWD